MCCRAEVRGQAAGKEGWAYSGVPRGRGHVRRGRADGPDHPDSTGEPPGLSTGLRKQSL